MFGTSARWAAERWAPGALAAERLGVQRIALSTDDYAIATPEHALWASDQQDEEESITLRPATATSS